MAHIGFSKNEHDIKVSCHKCDTCGGEFTVAPAIEEGVAGWENCMSDECASYDPHRDADVLFMSDREIAAEKSVVSLQKLKQRKQKNVW